MHRLPLLRLIDSYRTVFPEESSTIDRLYCFVAEESACFDRSHQAGHITGSAWIVDHSGGEILLTHHRKLGIWVQLGGHADGDPDVLSVAQREGEEESGLLLQTLSQDIFDIDIHTIPARPGEPEHQHYDVRFLFQASTRSVTISHESLALEWVPLEKISHYSNEDSLLRMAKKWQTTRRSISAL
ncbi:MAG: NUDIX hydrolase [Verrucomicrobiota bacterium]